MSEPKLYRLKGGIEGKEVFVRASGRVESQQFLTLWGPLELPGSRKAVVTVVDVDGKVSEMDLLTFSHLFEEVVEG